MSVPALSRAVLATAAVLLLQLGSASPAAAVSSRLTMGYLDGTIGDANGTATLADAAADGADAMRVSSGWTGIAPTRPVDPTDPTDPAYDWAGVDALVSRTRAAGLDVLLSLTGAPAWAEGPGRPSTAPPGTWRPDPVAFGRFAEALARHFDGTTPGVPRVRQFQPWNEPNLSTYLNPQWVRTGGVLRTASPAAYRRLLDAFARGVRRGQAGATVVSAGTAPFGDAFPGGRRIPPVTFVRELLCLDRHDRRVRGCGPVRFDVLAHHPYSTRGPLSPALNAGDVSVADMGRLQRLLRAAERQGTVRGPRRHPVWATEIAWSSDPPDDSGLPLSTQARWLSQTMWSLWRQGVPSVFWYQVRDRAPGADFASGTHLLDGTPKPAARAFRFPVVVPRRSGSRATVWLRAPASGTVTLELRRGGRWRTATTLAGRRHRVAQRSVRVAGATAVRAVQGDVASLSVPFPRR